MLEFGQIVQAVFVAIEAKHFFVLGFAQDFREDFGDAHVLVAGTVLLDQLHVFDHIAPGQESLAVEIDFLTFVADRRKFRLRRNIGRHIVQKARFRDNFKQSLVKPDSAGIGKGLQGCNFLRAELALGRIHRTYERQIVGVHQHSQVANDILDFFALVKAYPAVNLVRNVFGHQCFFYRTRLRVHAVKYRDILVMHAACALHGILDLFHNPLSFFAGVLGMVKDRRLAANPLWPQDLLDSKLIVLDDGIRHLQDAGCGAVIVLQQNGLGIFVSLVEFQNAVDIGAAPTVNSLVRITHHKKVLVVARQQIRQLVLLTVDILVFVDHDVHHALAPLVELFRKIFENVQRRKNQVVKVQRVILFLFVKVAVINPHPLVIGSIRKRKQVIFSGHAL